MPQSTLQTQCPKCQTRFRVTDEQLGVAKGKVRCGNCMSVFNAIEHQVLPGAAGAAAPVNNTGQKAAPSEPTTGEDDFIFADNPEEDATEGHYAGARLTFSEEELSDSFRSIDQRSQPEFHDSDDEPDTTHSDESWAEAMLRDVDTPPTAARTEPEPQSEPEPKAATEAPAAPDTLAAVSPPDTEGTPSSPPRAEELRVEPFGDAPGEAPLPDDADIPERDDPAREDSGFYLDDNDDYLDRPVHTTSPFNDLRREPVSVDSGSGGRLRAALWTVIVLVLLGVLVAQVTLFQFDRLSAIPELRPFYEKGCELAGCKLEPLVNVDAIQSRKLVVRTNPEDRSRLLVDAVIINRADFEQPFPAIALTFSNLNGDVVAQSIFTPEEYLAGDAKQLAVMPKDTPVRIAIDIRDPGRDAVNYNLSFRAYTP